MNLCDDCKFYHCCIERTYDMQPVEICTAYSSTTNLDVILIRYESASKYCADRRFHDFDAACDAMFKEIEAAKENGYSLVTKKERTMVVSRPNGDVICWDIYGKETSR